MTMRALRTGLLVGLLAGAIFACGREQAPQPRPAAAPAAVRDTAVPIATVGGLQARRTDTGLVADLLSANRGEGRLAVTVRFRNAATEPLAFQLSSEGGRYPGVRLTAGGRAWPLSRDEEGDPGAPRDFDIVVEPGQSRLWRGVFAAPPASLHAFDLEIPGVETFVDVPIRDVR